MEKLDIDGLPPERIEYLKNLIQLWRKGPKNGHQAQANGDQAAEPIVFETFDLGVTEEITRASAYED